MRQFLTTLLILLFSYQVAISIVPVNISEKLEKKQQEVVGIGDVPVVDKNLTRDKFVSTLESYFKSYDGDFTNKAEKIIATGDKKKIEQFYLSHFIELTQMNLDLLTSDDFKKNRETVMQWFNIPSSFVPDPSVNLFNVENYGTCVEKDGIFAFEIVHKNQLDIKERFILSGIGTFPTYLISSSTKSSCMDRIDFLSMYKNALAIERQYVDYKLRLQGQNCGHNFYVLEKVKKTKIDDKKPDATESKVVTFGINAGDFDEVMTKEDFKLLIVPKGSDTIKEPKVNHFHFGESVFKSPQGDMKRLHRISFVFDNILKPDFSGESMGVIIPLSDMDAVKQPSISDANGMWYMHIFKED